MLQEDPGPICNFDDPQSDDFCEPDFVITHKANLILTLTVGVIAIIILGTLAAFVYHKRNHQAIKIKSPYLMIVSLSAQAFIIISLILIQVYQEKCVYTGK